MKTTQTLHIKEPKKHSVRYDAAPNEADPMLTSIYVLKGCLPRPFPNMITVTVEAVEA